LDTTSRGTFNFGGSYVSNNNHLFANSSYEYEGLAAGVPTAYGPYSPSNVGSISFISGLGTFVGTALTVRLKTLSGYGFTGGGNNAAASLTQLGSGTAKITYTYNEAPPPVPTVPEAATWAMMLAGFGMMGATLRRRRPSVSFG
jgi:hypothetical protein